MNDIEAQIAKFSGFSKTTQNRLNNDMFADIHESINRELEEITLEKIRSFFINYFDFDITEISNLALKRHIEKTVTIYTERSTIIYDEIQELETLKKRVSAAIDEIVFESFDLQSSFFSFFYRNRLEQLSKKMRNLSSKIDALDEAMQRRVRWSVDMIIGDYYILYMMFSHLYTLITEYNREDIRVFVTQNLNNLTHTIEESLQYYLPADARVINRFIVLEFEILKDQI
jgi:uncharacterized membrane protein YheB (UPF0754 family)